MSIRVYLDSAREPFTVESWERARQMFLDCVEADQGASVWDVDDETNGAVELWKFDGMARQASMRPIKSA